MEKLKVLPLFSGIGAFEKALEREEIPHEVVAYCEIDKFASKSYSTIHNIPESLNLGDISKVDTSDIPECDLVTYGFPCQDISTSGLQKGIKAGETRSGLLYEALRIIEAKKPKYAIAENVKNLVGKRFKADFETLLATLDDMGYNSYWQVLNAKDYGVPQNRERVFVVSIRKDIDTNTFAFPEKQELTLCLRDKLEETVDSKYYLTGKYDSIVRVNDNYGMLQGGVFKNGFESMRRVYETSYVSPTIPTCISGNSQPKIFERSYISGRIPEWRQRGLIYGDNALAPTLLSIDYKTPKLVSDASYQVRKLTPRECWRLMGFDDTDIDKCISVGMSNSQLYKQAGNSIVVNVLQAIFRALF